MTGSKSMDADLLLSLIMPVAHQRMGKTVIKQVQKVLDAAALNHEIATKRNSAWQSATVFESNHGSLRFSDLASKAVQLQASIKGIDKRSKHIRLDFHRLIDPMAVSPVTDNPDEKEYLSKVFHALVRQGVWLRFDHRWIESPGDNSVSSEHTFRAWLSFGYNGPEIPAPMGYLTREALLSAVTVGKGYYAEVYKGPLLTRINEMMRDVDGLISTGKELHDTFNSIRRSAAPGVVPGSDILGGANFPDKKIWDVPFDLLLEAKSKVSNGKLLEAVEILFDAEISVKIVALQLDKQIEKTGVGAERAVWGLDKLRTAGKVAEATLLVYGLATGVARMIASRAGTEAAAAATRQIAKDRTKAALAKTISNSPAAFARTMNNSRIALASTAKYEEVFSQLLKLRTGSATGIGAAARTIEQELKAADHISKIIRAAQEEIGLEKWFSDRALRAKAFEKAFEQARRIFGS